MQSEKSRQSGSQTGRIAGDEPAFPPTSLSASHPRFGGTTEGWVADFGGRTERLTDRRHDLPQGPPRRPRRQESTVANLSPTTSTGGRQLRGGPQAPLR